MNTSTTEYQEISMEPQERPVEQRKATAVFSMSSLYRRGDRIMMWVLWAAMLVSLGLASWYDTWLEAIIIGLPAALVSTLLMKMMPGTRLTRNVNGAAFMVMSALLIHQGHGMIELHFSIFVLLAFLLYYRDWMPIVVAAAVIAVHHLAFNFLQEWGYGIYVFGNRTGIDIVLIHAAYVVFESTVLIYMALQLHKEGIQSQEVNQIVEQISVSGNEIDLCFRHDNATSEVAVGINTFMDAVYNAIKKAQDVSGHLVATTDRVNAIIEQSDRGAQNQRMETDQVAASMNEMAATVQEVARNARDAASAATEADSAANDGRQVVERTVEAINVLAEKVDHADSVINKLADDSNNIGSVLDVIKGIAEQTNLLALNAAIEAARAGEQGRGFAVVADEVRTLASRTQESTAEIQGMIENLQSGAKGAVVVIDEGRTQAQEGVALSAQAGEALVAIVNAIGTIRDMNNQISSAADEQSVVAEEINRAIVKIRDVAENSAEGMYNATESSDKLAQVAEQLTTLVGRFKL